MVHVCVFIESKSTISNAGKNFTDNSVDEQAIFNYTLESGAAVVGGVVYKGTLLPTLNDTFVFGDYVSVGSFFLFLAFLPSPVRAGRSRLNTLDVLRNTLLCYGAAHKLHRFGPLSSLCHSVQGKFFALSETPAGLWNAKPLNANNWCSSTTPAKLHIVGFAVDHSGRSSTPSRSSNDFFARIKLAPVNFSARYNYRRSNGRPIDCVVYLLPKNSTNGRFTNVLLAGELLVLADDATQDGSGRGMVVKLVQISAAPQLPNGYVRYFAIAVMYWTISQF